jgi:hypothetical protein
MSIVEWHHLEICGPADFQPIKQFLDRLNALDGEFARNIR